jgi:hypothetical protein
MSNPALELAVSQKQKDEETIREEDVTDATPKDMRFWLIMVGLLFATFISALDMTGNVVCLSNCSSSKLISFIICLSHKYGATYYCPCTSLPGFHLGRQRI